MSLWFRMYAEVLNDPKVQRLPGEIFKAWVNILCLCAKNGGRIPPIDDVAFALRETRDGAETVLERLLNAGLIDRCSGGADGAHYAAHEWKKRQYKSDTSTDRVKRFRERFNNDAVTPPETETESETDKSSVAKATSLRDDFPRPDFADPQHWKDFLRNRKTKKLTNSPTAHKNLLRDIAKFADEEWPPCRLIEHAAAKGWGGIYDPRERSNGHGRSNGTSELGDDVTIRAARAFVADGKLQ